MLAPRREARNPCFSSNTQAFCDPIPTTTSNKPCVSACALAFGDPPLPSIILLLSRPMSQYFLQRELPLTWSWLVMHRSARMYRRFIQKKVYLNLGPREGDLGPLVSMHFGAGSTDYYVWLWNRLHRAGASINSASKKIKENSTDRRMMPSPYNQLGVRTQAA